MQREPGLARAARAGERDDAIRLEQRQHLPELSFSAHERRRLHGEVRLVDASQRRELAVVELVEPFRSREVFEPVQAEVAQAIGAVFTLTATGLYDAAGAHTAAFALIGVLAVFASLEAAFGLCVGCKAFYLGMRLGLVPPAVCEDCARVLAVESA